MGAFDSVQQVAKGVAGAVAGAVVSVIFTTITDPDAVLNPDAPAAADEFVQMPNTTAEWVALLIAVLIGFGLPFVKRNYPSVNKASDDLELAKQRVRDGKQRQ